MDDMASNICGALRLGVPCAVVDVNDLTHIKGKFLVLGASEGVDAAILGMALLRNPAGNGDQQTPLAGPYICIFSCGTSQVVSRDKRLKVPAETQLTSRPWAATSRAAAAAVVQWCTRSKQ